MQLMSQMMAKLPSALMKRILGEMMLIIIMAVGLVGVVGLSFCLVMGGAPGSSTTVVEGGGSRGFPETFARPCSLVLPVVVAC